jgi:aerobic carbon-monoxide dehydrogenase medium subunit
MIKAYVLPDTADAAAELARGALLMAGGTTVMPEVTAGRVEAERVVGLARAGLDTIERSGERTVLGATASLARVAQLDGAPAVAAAAGAVGGPALRNVATVGGNLLAGAPYGDVAVALLAMGADVDLGGRTIPLERLWDELATGELIRSVAFDDAPGVFVRCARRAANSPAVVSVAVSGGRVALGGVSAHPVRSPAAEAHFNDPQAAGEAAAAEVDPPTDGIASAWYRRRMTSVFVRRALEAFHAL